MASKKNHAEGARRSFPPSVVVAVKALACELPHESGQPLSRWSLSEIKREVVQRGIVAAVGETTLWRWLAEDAIRPWTHRSWIFPRDPDFEAKAGRVLDLYEGRWKGKRLRPADCVISADEKTGIQALRRCHPTVPPAAHRPALVEHEYKREGTLAYLAAWDVRRAKLHGRCEPTVGIAPFGRLVEQVMSNEPYRSAPRVFWILDNGTSHRGQRCVDRLRQRWPNVIVVHLPKHASWLNPNRDLLLGRSTQGSHPSGFRLPRRAEGKNPSLSGALPESRPTVSNGDSPVATWPSYSTS